MFGSINLTDTQVLRQNKLILSEIKIYGDNEPVTYTVTVMMGFYIDGVSAPILTLKRGTTYTFDPSDNTNKVTLRFKDGDGNTYTSGVVATGTPGSLEVQVTFVVASDAPDDLRYYCTVHGLCMGNVISVIDQIF